MLKQVYKGLLFIKRQTKLKAPADDNQMVVYAFDRVENIVEKGDNDDYQHFLLVPHFLWASFTVPLKGGISLSKFQYNCSKTVQRSDQYMEE